MAEALPNVAAESRGLDAEAYAVAVERLQPALRRWALRNVPANDAEDLVAEVLTAMWARRSTRNPELGELDAWVWGIARIELSRHRRTLGRAATPEVPIDRDEPSAEDSALLTLAATAGIALVAAGIAALSDTDYSAITDAAATYLGITRGGAAMPLDAAARVRLHRIRRRLGGQLDR